MTSFQIFNVICAIVFVLFWGVAQWKGGTFLTLPLWKRLLIAAAVTTFMVGWIVYDRVHMGI